MFYGIELKSRLLLGTAQYPSPAELLRAIETSQTEVITVSLRREGPEGGAFRDILRQTGCRILPNTAGCHSAREAITTAQMAREIFGTNWIKLEVIGHADTLQPDPFGLLEAASQLCLEGFDVFPYTTDDLVLGERLLEAGCKVLMPWAAPIGSGQGLQNKDRLKAMRAWFPDTPIIIDAGIGAPSQAAEAMEMGMDGILLNTAVARSKHPALMAEAFRKAVEAGRDAYTAGLMRPQDMAFASTPVFGMADL